MRTVLNRLPTDRRPSVLRLFARPKPSSSSRPPAPADRREPPRAERAVERAVARAATLGDVTAPAERRTVCALSACAAGSRATILEVRCGDADACRLRALGLCEGASVNVVRSRDCTLLEVRGSRLALGAAIASGITVLPVA